jgi:Rrf2 family protein
VGANSRYTVAIHALLLLQDRSGSWVTSEWIASSASTNPVVIRRLLQRLQSVGLVEGQKGARGGYRLRRPASEITLWAVYEAMREDGPFGLHPSTPNPRCPVGGNIQDHLKDVYAEAEASMKRVLRKTTLRALRRQVTGERA